MPGSVDAAHFVIGFLPAVHFIYTMGAIRELNIVPHVASQSGSPSAYVHFSSHRRWLESISL